MRQDRKLYGSLPAHPGYPWRRWLGASLGSGDQGEGKAFISEANTTYAEGEMPMKPFPDRAGKEPCLAAGWWEFGHDKECSQAAIWVLITVSFYVVYVFTFTPWDVARAEGRWEFAELWACCSSASAKTLFCPQTFPHTSWQPCHLHLSKAGNFQPSWGSTHGRSLYCVSMDNACWPKMALCPKRSEKAEHGKRKDYYAYFREWDLKPEEWPGKITEADSLEAKIKIFTHSFGFYLQHWLLSNVFQ